MGSHIKIISVVAAFALNVAFADTQIVDGIEWTYTVSNGKASCGNGYGGRAVPDNTKGSITIPASLGGYPVASIGSSAFDGCSGLTSVTIPDSVTSIGGSAFSGCNAALYDTTTILGVKLVDGWVVDNDSPSGDLDLAGVRGIADSAFWYCSGLTSVTIPDGVTSIGYEAFWCCSGLTSVTIPDGVTSIGSSAFYGCRGLTSVAIPDSVTSKL